MRLEMALVAREVSADQNRGTDCRDVAGATRWAGVRGCDRDGGDESGQNEDDLQGVR